MSNLQSHELILNISALLDNARKKVVSTVNQTMVITYFEIGRMIVVDEQQGKNRAEYGKAILKDLSLHLTERFGKGFSETNLRQMRNFYDLYSQFKVTEKKGKYQTLPAEFQLHDNQPNENSSNLLTNLNISPKNTFNFNLSWSHYLKLMIIKNIEERKFYEIEVHKNSWSLRELQRIKAHSL